MELTTSHSACGTHPPLSSLSSTNFDDSDNSDCLSHSNNSNASNRHKKIELCWEKPKQILDGEHKRRSRGKGGVHNAGRRGSAAMDHPNGLMEEEEEEDHNSHSTTDYYYTNCRRIVKTVMNNFHDLQLKTKYSYSSLLRGHKNATTSTSTHTTAVSSTRAHATATANTHQNKDLAKQRKLNLLKKRKRKRNWNKVKRYLGLIFAVYFLLSYLMGDNSHNDIVEDELEELNSVLEALLKNKQLKEQQQEEEKRLESSVVETETDVPLGSSSHPQHQESSSSQPQHSNHQNQHEQQTPSPVKDTDYNSSELQHLQSKLDDLKQFLGSVEGNHDSLSLQEERQQECDGNSKLGTAVCDSNRHRRPSTVVDRPIEPLPESLWRVVPTPKEEYCDSCINEYETTSLDTILSKKNENDYQATITTSDSLIVTKNDNTLSGKIPAKCSLPLSRRFFPECRAYPRNQSRATASCSSSPSETSARSTQSPYKSTKTTTSSGTLPTSREGLPEKIIRPSKETRSVRDKMRRLQQDASSAISVVVPKLKKLQCSIPILNKFFGCQYNNNNGDRNFHGQGQYQYHQGQHGIHDLDVKNLCRLPLVKHMTVCQNNNEDSENIEALCSLKMLVKYADQCHYSDTKYDAPSKRSHRNGSNSGRNNNDEMAICDVPFLKDLADFCLHLDLLPSTTPAKTTNGDTGDMWNDDLINLMST